VKNSLNPREQAAEEETAGPSLQNHQQHLPQIVSIIELRKLAATNTQKELAEHRDGNVFAVIGTVGSAPHFPAGNPFELSEVAFKDLLCSRIIQTLLGGLEENRYRPFRFHRHLDGRAKRVPLLHDTPILTGSPSPPQSQSDTSPGPLARLSSLHLSTVI
jgi:hypothetical protein